MLLALVLGLLCGFLGSIPIAGPVAVLVVERALGGRAREGLALAAGAAIAEGVYAGLAFLGMTAALARFPWLLPVSRVLGAVILVALGLYFAFRKSKPAGQDEEKKDRKRGRRGGPFVLGLVVTMVNPTLLVTWSAVVTVIHGAMRVQESAAAAPFFGLGAMSGILSWFTLFTMLLKRFREKMGPRTLDKVVRGIGWALVAVGLGLGAKVGLQWHHGH